MSEQLHPNDPDRAVQLLYDIAGTMVSGEAPPWARENIMPEPTAAAETETALSAPVVIHPGVVPEALPVFGLLADEMLLNAGLGHEPQEVRDELAEQLGWG